MLQQNAVHVLVVVKLLDFFRRSLVRVEAGSSIAMDPCRRRQAYPSSSHRLPSGIVTHQYSGQNRRSPVRLFLERFDPFAKLLFCELGNVFAIQNDCRHVKSPLKTGAILAKICLCGKAFCCALPTIRNVGKLRAARG